MEPHTAANGETNTNVNNSYGIRVARSCILDHPQQSYINDEQLKFIVKLCEGHDDLIRAHSREVGMCSHTTALLWHMGVDGETISSTHPSSTTKLLAAIDNSMLFSEQEADSDDFVISSTKKTSDDAN
ncbi:unnamed protein product [Adineta ricciae]|uniref:Uncharacterized protein n=1 Tax=Adineta ricciae TaxID=249248 RepID=A0A814MLP4_ADIRI|nr:unnamed protein product [Adineta ricciae]CAF1080711.1 unnamed protein product [Adineta ricciae]